MIRNRSKFDRRIRTPPVRSSSRINKLKNITADLGQKLKICYKSNSKKYNDTVEKIKVATDGAETTYVPNSGISLKLPETPTDNSVYDDSEFISCTQLCLKHKLNNAHASNKDIDVEVDRGDNKLVPKRARLNSNNATSSIKSKNVISPITVSNGKRLSRNDDTNSHRLESSDVFVHQHKTSSNKVLQNEVRETPVIDRSSKPTNLTYNSRCKEILKIMKELNELAKSKANELLNEECEHHLQRAEIESLKIKLEDVHKMYLKIENEYNTCVKETDTTKFNSTDDTEKKNLEFNLSLLKKEVEDVESGRKKLQEEFLEREHREITIKQNDSDTHKEPLKPDGSSINTALERPYSSSNLLQECKAAVTIAEPPATRPPAPILRQVRPQIPFDVAPGVQILVPHGAVHYKRIFRHIRDNVRWTLQFDYYGKLRRVTCSKLANRAALDIKC